MLFNLIFGSLFVAGWLTCAYLPWLTLSIATRGNAGLSMLPLCLFTGVVAAVAVAVLGLDTGTGLVLSFLSAAIASALLLAVRRYATMPARAPGLPVTPDSGLPPQPPDFDPRPSDLSTRISR